MRLIPHAWSKVAAALLLGSLTSVSSLAAEGGLDATFGSGGKATTSFIANTENVARGVAIQTDGRIVVAGYAGSAYDNVRGRDFALARFNADGSLDTSFGSGGKVTTDFSDSRGVSIDDAYAVAIQTDGKIVVVGSAGGARDFAVARYNTNGSLDTAFGSAGKFTSYSLNSPTYYFSGGSATSVAIQSDGRIVVAGYIYNAPEQVSGNQYDFVVMRLDAKGAPDGTFGSGGVKVIAVGPGYDFDYAYAVAVQSDGKIVVAGSSGPYNAGTDNFAVVRLNANGSLDTAFGTGGKLVADFSGKDDKAYAIALQADGKIVVAGQAAASPYGGNLAMLRLSTNGTLDTGFGSGGKVTTSLSSSPSSNASTAYGVAIQSDGKIVIAGVKEVYYLVLARYSSNGALDGTFGTGGIVSTTGYDNAYGVAIQSDGKIVTAGTSNGSRTDFGIARYLGGAVTVSATGQADCVFAWAERNYSSYFSPAGPPSGTALDYHYRYYSTSNSYLALAGRDGRLYYFGSLSQNTLLDLGTLAQWVAMAGCQ